MPPELLHADRGRHRLLVYEAKGLSRTEIIALQPACTNGTLTKIFLDAPTRGEQGTASITC